MTRASDVPAAAEAVLVLGRMFTAAQARKMLGATSADLARLAAAGLLRP